MAKAPKPFAVPKDLFGVALDVDIKDPATDAEFTRTQKVLGVRLPAELLVVLKVRNGGSIKRSSVKLPAASAKVAERKRYSLTRLAGVHPSDSDAITQLTALARDEWDLPDGLIPLSGDGHSWCCLDYRTAGPKGEPTITHVDLDAPLEFTVAPTFAALISKLYREIENLTPALIALDEGAPMGKRLDAALATIGAAPHTIPSLVSNPRHPPPPIWQWPKFRGLLKDSPVWIEYQRNKLYEMSIQKTLDRPPKHPMLCVAVHPDDQEAGLRELLAALGPKAVLIHGVQ